MLNGEICVLVCVSVSTKIFLFLGTKELIGLPISKKNGLIGLPTRKQRIHSFSQKGKAS